MGIRIGSKKAGPDGTRRGDVEEFLYDALTGKPIPVKYPVYNSLPGDWNGDGIHELVREDENGTVVLDAATGKVMARLQGAVAATSKLLDAAGEQC